MYSTADDVKSVTFANKMGGAGWNDDDIYERIEEADNVIDSRLRAMGFPAPFTVGELDQQGNATAPFPPPLVRDLSILYARWAISRDLFHEVAPSSSSGDGYKSYIERFEKIMEHLAKGEMVLIGFDGTIFTHSVGRVAITTENVPRALDMGEPSRSVINSAYYDHDTLENF